MKILTAAEMREVDRLTTQRYGVPSAALMQRAGDSVADFVRARFSNLAGRRLLVLCGKKNNGGDGFAAACRLLELGAKPVVILLASLEEVGGDAAAHLKRYQSTSGELRVVRDTGEWQSCRTALASAEIIVDALLGTGVRGAVEGILAEVIRDVNALRSPAAAVVAVDVPSGLVADTGESRGEVVVADYTVTFTAPKPGFFFSGGNSHTGQLVVRSIGSPAELIEDAGKGNLRWSEPGEFKQFAVRRKPAGHKGDYGHALIVAGSVGKSGAAILAGTAALRAGAGLVTVATPEPMLSIVAAHTPEIMTEPLAATRSGTISERCLEGHLFATLLKGKRALAVGPGLTTNEETQAFVRRIVRDRSDVPIVLDADGLNAFAGRAADLTNSGGKITVTPHPGEMARLLGCATQDVQSRRLEVALKAATDWNAIVILKGHQTVIAAPDGSACINSTGNPGMGTGGTGDVLTGMLAGLTAQYAAEPWARTLAFGVYLHGLAGDIAYADTGEAPLIASDLIRAIPRAYRQFYSECGRG
ncbi:MAG: NAD(P)H-hydrate dehydratase [Candidatus Acidiferrales bacterium]